MKPELHVVVLAAGKGKRMRSDLPKVLQPLAKRPLLAHVLDTARSLNPNKLHAVIGHGGRVVRRSVGASDDVRWVEQVEQLGTGHAVQMALPAIPKEAQVLVLMGDSPLVGAASLREVLAATGSGFSILSAVVSEPDGYGRIVRDADGEVERIVEHADADASIRGIHEVNSGMAAAPAGALGDWLSAVGRDNSQGEVYLTDCVAVARRAGARVGAVAAHDPDEILGANDRWQLAHLERAFQRREARRLCLDGATLMDPERIDVRGTLAVSPGVVIDVNAVFEGDNALAEGVHVGAHCVLSDCRLGPGTRVHPHSVLDGVQTEGDCDIGPFARLRPGTELALNTRVGNFVETKKAILGRGTKASHLSYLGDARIGSEVNIGAGTITCNYDGVNKHQTVIGDRAFIGSDTQLVAPVEVGPGANIGAGSTITRDAPAEALTVARARQVTVKGWKRPRKKS